MARKSKASTAFVPFSEVDTLFVARELKPLQGRRVEAVLRTGALDLVVLFSGGSWVLFSADARWYRVHLLQQVQVPAGPLAPLEQALKGFTLQRVAVPRGERMLLLEFTGTNRLGERLQRVLVAELMGRYSQVVLLGENRRILWTLKTVGPEQSRVRTLQVGGRYQPPPAKPWSLTDPERNPEALRRQAPRVFPVPPGEDPVAFLGRYLQEAPARPAPGLARWQDRWIVLPAPVPGLALEVSTETVSHAWELLWDRLHPAAPATPPLQRIRRELEKLAAYDRWNQVAEAVLLRRDELLAQGRLEVPLSNGTREIVTLEPGETPESLSARYRALAARWKRGYHKLQQRLRELETGAEAPPPAEPAGPSDSRPSARYRVYTSPSGFAVYVGRNARGNEEVTFRLASPDDYFFHARGVPGAHVILKTGRREPREEDLYFAARLALQHSRAAADGKGEVSYTRVRYLRKPRKAPPGLVILTREQVLEVRL